MRLLEMLTSHGSRKGKVEKKILVFHMDIFVREQEEWGCARSAKLGAVDDTGADCPLADGLPCPWAWPRWAEPGTCNRLHRQALTQAGVEPGPGSGCGLQVGAKAGRVKGRAGDKATLRIWGVHPGDWPQANLWHRAGEGSPAWANVWFLGLWAGREWGYQGRLFRAFRAC